jgi:hypothetical protein
MAVTEDDFEREQTWYLLLFNAVEEEHRQRTGHEIAEHNACHVCQMLRKCERILP